MDPIPTQSTVQDQSTAQIPTPEVPSTTSIPVVVLPWYEKYKSLLIIAGVIITIVIGTFVFGSTSPKKITVAPTPTPTSYPTPTPNRTLSPLSGLQEFRNLDAEVSSFSARLDSISLDDPSLVPPVLTLPLGFQN